MINTQCKNCAQGYNIEDADLVFYEKIKVPPPTWCPECRLMRRMMWRNERTLYQRPCGLCQKKIVSIFAPEADYNVYCPDCWWSDGWDGSQYARDYDPSRPFLEQFNELLHKAPLMARFGLWATVVNSEFTNAVSNLRNCYLIGHSDFDENCAYGSMITNSKDCFDNFLIDGCELVYELVNCRKCARAFYSVDCESCFDISYCRNCSGCSNCYGCVNLRNKQYHIFNESYPKEEYEEKVKQLQGQDPRQLWSKFPQKFIHGTHNVNVTGDYIYNCKNTKNSYIVADAEDCKFCCFVTPEGLKDSYDFSHFGIHSEFLYETMMSGEQASHIKFCWWAAISVREIEYSAFCSSSDNLFGCVGMRKKSHCILNKQYSPEEYKALVAQIKAKMTAAGEYGEFFPPRMAPFAYNETTAQEFFPLTKETAIQKGFRWREREKRNYTIGGEILGCGHEQECNHDCTGAFRLIPIEKDFLARFNLPAPRFCPNCRHSARLKYRNPEKLYKRTCAKCSAELETTYSPDRPEVVYCEKCYQQEVI